MTTKLTLTIEEDVISSAKLYASRKGRSLSDLVESYLKTLAGVQKPEEKLSPRVKRLAGSVNLPDDFNYKKHWKQTFIKNTPVENDLPRYRCCNRCPRQPTTPCGSDRSTF